MTIEERIADYHKNRGCNCGQCTLCLLGEYTGLEELTAIRLAQGFGGGLLCGNLCGAVTGGMVALGLACTTGEDPAAEKPEISGLCEKLQERFKERFGTLLCGDILREHEHTLCDSCIAFGVRTAEEIIKEYKKL